MDKGTLHKVMGSGWAREEIYGELDSKRQGAKTEKTPGRKAMAEKMKRGVCM